MSAWFQSGQVIDAILVLMLAEGALLWFVQARTGRGLPLRAILTFLASGAALMLALRAALIGDGWEIISAFLLIGLAAHLADIAGRWK
jgi:hypothetical protein